METRYSPEMSPVTPHERQAELKRVLDSKYFFKAAKRKLFLEFVNNHASRGEGDKLNEYLIGVEVYDRGTDFDPQQDPIVRVQAHEIRRALKSYYEAEGKESPLRVELPLGQYAPLFTRVKAEVTEPAVSTVPQEAAAKASGPNRSFWRVVLPALLALLCVVLGYLLIRERTLPHNSPAASPALSEAAQWFWKPFLVAGSSPLVVVTSTPALRLATRRDSAQTLKQAYAIPKSKLSGFQDTPHFHELDTFTFVPTTADYTGMGEALGLASLAKLLVSQGAPIRVKPSRLADYTEIQSSNTIMLGGANQWTSRALPSPQTFSPSISEGVITNRNPGPGEQSVYVPKFDPETGVLVRDYAVVVMLPNRAKEERLLRLDGISTQGTEAAAAYVTNPDSLAELRQALLAASPDKNHVPPFFEALLSVPVENFVPGGASLVAVRIIPE